MRNQSFHKRFAQGLSRFDANSMSLLKPVGTGDQQRRFNIYRNNRVVSLIDALRSTYPAIEKLVGDEFFKASARAYIEAHPPTQPVMAEYGSGFGQFISAFPGTGRFPFLADVAELEWQYLQSFHSADAAVIDATALSAIASESIMYIGMDCHPALHVIESAWPVGTIWTSCVRETDSSLVDMQQGEAVVITRPDLQVQVNTVDSAAVIFLNAIRAGDTLTAAAEQALESDMTFDAGAGLVSLLALGAFSGFKEHKTIT